MAKFKRCVKGECEEPKLRRKRGTEGHKDDEKVYFCQSDKTTPCPPTKEDKCKCFVVVQHFIKDKGITEEVSFPVQSDEHDAGLLTEAERKEKYPGPKEKGGSADDHWRLMCQCLQIDKNGKPEEE
jgi:hypothetical protein